MLFRLPKNESVLDPGVCLGGLCCDSLHYRPRLSIVCSCCWLCWPVVLPMLCRA